MSDTKPMLDEALLDTALEEHLGKAAPPDLAAAVMAAAARADADDRDETAARARWRWFVLAAALVLCGAGLGQWWRTRAAQPPQQAAPPTSDDSKQDGHGGSEFYRPRDLAEVLAILAREGALDVQFHRVGAQGLATMCTMGPPAPTLPLGRGARGKAMLSALHAALAGASPITGVDATARTHGLYVRANEDKRLHLALLGGAVWIDGLGTFRADVQFDQQLRAAESETRRALGIVHRDELGDGLPNELIPAEQAVLRPVELRTSDVAKLGKLRALRTLDLRWCKDAASAAFLEQVADLHNVRELRLPALDDALAAIVARLPLQSLLVLGPDEAPWRDQLAKTCAGLTRAASVTSLRELRTLVLPGAGLPRSELARLATLRNLETLVLTGACPPSDAVSVWGAFANHRKLADLRLTRSSLGSRRSDLAELAQISTLGELTLDACLADLGERAAPDTLRELQSGLGALATAPALHRLSLGGWFPEHAEPFTPGVRDALVRVAMIPTMNWLALPDCPGLRADDLLALGAAKNLDTLLLCGTVGDKPGRVPYQAIAELMNAIPGLTLIAD